METSVIISLIFGISSIVASYFYGYIPAMRKAKIDKLNSKILLLYRDIDIMNDIESRLIDELSVATKENKETIKRRVRKEISDNKGFVLSDLRKPSNVKNEINRYLSKEYC